MAVMKVMGASGHSATTYDPEIEEEVKPVEDEFNRLVGGGFKAFTVDAGTRRVGEEIVKFDRTAKEIVLTHPLVGG